MVLASGEACAVLQPSRSFKFNLSPNARRASVRVLYGPTFQKAVSKDLLNNESMMLLISDENHCICIVLLRGY